MSGFEYREEEFYPKRETYLKVSADLFKIVTEGRRSSCTSEEVIDVLKREGITSPKEVARAIDWLVKEGYLKITGSGYMVATLYS